MQNTAQIWFQFLMSFHPRTPISFFPLSFWQTRVFVNGMHASTTLPIYLHQPNNNNLFFFWQNYFVFYIPHLIIEHWDGKMGLCYTSQHNFELFRLNSELKKLSSYFTFILFKAATPLLCTVCFLQGYRELLTFIFQSWKE